MPDESPVLVLAERALRVIVPDELRLVGEQLRRRSPARLVLEVGERLAAAISDGEASLLLFDGPQRRRYAANSPSCRNCKAYRLIAGRLC